MNLFYFDSTNPHEDWWKKVDRNFIKIENHEFLKSLFVLSGSNYKKIIFKKNEKNFFIFHSGEAYFNKSFETWQKEWNKFWKDNSDFEKNLFVCFFSSGTIRFDRRKIEYPKNFEFFQNYSNQNKTISKFKRFINQFEKNGMITPNIFENQTALFILCQGYLAAHGGESLRGWAKLSPELKNKVRGKQTETEKKDWWRGIETGKVKAELESLLFNPADEGPQKRVTPESNIKGKEQVENLLKQIEEDGLDLEIVRDAYLGLADSMKPKV